MAIEYEERGDLKAAEEEYLKAGDWKVDFFGITKKSFHVLGGSEYVWRE